MAKPTNYISVESVEEYSKKIEALGGKIVVPKMEIPGLGWWAIALDPEGNHFGILEYKQVRPALEPDRRDPVVHRDAVLKGPARQVVDRIPGIKDLEITMKIRILENDDAGATLAVPVPPLTWLVRIRSGRYQQNQGRGKVA